MEPDHHLPGIARTLSLLIILTGFVQTGFATIDVVSVDLNATVHSIEENGIETAIAYKLQGRLVLSNPINACRKPAPPPTVGDNNTLTPLKPDTTNKWILVATLDTPTSCSLSRKAKNAQAAGYSGIIIQHLGSNDSRDAIPGFIGMEWVGVKIYTCVVGNLEGDILKNFTYPKPYFVKFENEPSFSVGFLGNITIIIFFGLVGICVCVRGTCFCYSRICHGVQERRRKRKILLAASELKKLPVLRWVPELPQETCSICLEHFVVKDQVRLLPCSHVFHVQCIDPWLLHECRKCPNCKRRVLFLSEYFSDSESSSTSSAEDEQEPLLRDTLDHYRFLQTLTDSHHQRHNSSFTLPSPTSSSSNANDPANNLQVPKGQSENVVISVHSENDTSQTSGSTSTSCVSQDDSFTMSSEIDTEKHDAAFVDCNEDLANKSHTTNEESLSFHSCQGIESDRDELFLSMEQRI